MSEYTKTSFAVDRSAELRLLTTRKGRYSDYTMYISYCVASELFYSLPLVREVNVALRHGDQPVHDFIAVAKLVGVVLVLVGNPNTAVLGVRSHLARDSTACEIAILRKYLIMRCTLR